MSATRPPSHGRLYALLILMILLWGGNFVVGKIALRSFPPLFVAGLRAVLSGIMILPVYFWDIRRPQTRAPWTAQEIPQLLLAGVVGVVLNQVLFVFGLSRTSAAHAAIVASMMPMIALLLASIAGHERIGPVKIAGVALAASGVALLQIGRNSAHGPSLLGDLFILLSVFALAAYTVFGKSVAMRHGSITVNTFAYVGGGLLILPAVFWQGARMDLGAVGIAPWLSVLYMALFPSVIAYLIYGYALQHLPASRVSAFSYLQPLFATSLAAIFLHEIPGGGFIAGAALVLFGVGLAERGIGSGTQKKSPEPVVRR